MKKTKITLRIATSIMLCLALLTVGSSGADAQTKKKTTAVRRTTTTARRTTTTAKPAQPQVTAERLVGKDGFVWFRTKKGDLYGAVDEQGNTIVPMEYDEVTYKLALEVGTRFFYAMKKINGIEYKAAYSPKGKCIIPIDRGYTFLYLGWTGNRNYIYFNTGKYGDSGYGICDAQGSEVIAPNNDFMFPGPKLCESYGTLYLEITPNPSKRTMPFDNGYGLYDANGKCIIPINQVVRSWPNETNTAIQVVPYPGGVKDMYEKPIRLTTNYMFDYFNYDNMCFTPPTRDEGNENYSASTSGNSGGQQNVPQGYYIPEGGTVPVPIGYKPTMVRATKSNGLSIDNTSVNGVPASSMGGSSSSSGKSGSHVSSAQIQQQINVVNQAEARWRANPSDHNARANYEAAKRALNAMQGK